MNSVPLSGAKACEGIPWSRQAAISPWQEEPFQDRSPFWDRHSEGRLPNEGEEPSEDVVQYLDLYVKEAAYLVFEDVQGGPHSVRRVLE